jgi:hypothetical protein
VHQSVHGRPMCNAVTVAGADQHAYPTAASDLDSNRLSWPNRRPVHANSSRCA